MYYSAFVTSIVLIRTFPSALNSLFCQFCFASVVCTLPHNWIHSKIFSVPAFCIIGLARIPRISLSWTYHYIRMVMVIAMFLSVNVLVGRASEHNHGDGSQSTFLPPVCPETPTAAPLAIPIWAIPLIILGGLLIIGILILIIIKIIFSILVSQLD